MNNEIVPKYIDFSVLEQWCKDQKEKGYGKVNVNDITKIILNDIYNIQCCYKCKKPVAKVQVTSECDVFVYCGDCHTGWD
jgi:hypothetical protein